MDVTRTFGKQGQEKGTDCMIERPASSRVSSVSQSLLPTQPHLASTKDGIKKQGGYAGQDPYSYRLFLPCYILCA